METLYWMGVKTILYPESKMEELVIHQWDVYEEPMVIQEFFCNEKHLNRYYYG